MKIGYIAASIYRLTFEINEVVELLRQAPDTRVYSFHRPKGSEIQSLRVQDVPVEIRYWSVTSVLRGLFYLVARYPGRLLLGAVRLAVRSAPNPIYWIKNFLTFFLAMPILADADKNGVDHLHADFGSSPATIAWLGKGILGTEMSVTFHAFDIYSRTLVDRDPLKKQKLRDADVVIAVHRDGLEHLMSLVPDVDKNKFETIHICVEFSPAKRLDPLPDPPLFLAAGNLLPKKGFDVLVKAAGMLAREGAAIRVRILGEGSERERLEALVRAEGVGALTEIPGYYQQADLAGHLAEATAFVVPSKVAVGGHRDGIPTVMVEAWLSRAPVIASPVGGMGEVLVDGETALVFQPDDSEALARCIRRVLDSQRLRETLSEGGSRAAQTQFSPKQNVGKLLETLRRASGRRGNQP